QYKPWRLFILVCGLPGFFSALCLFKFPESPKFTLSVGREAYTLKSLRTIYTWNTGKDPAEFEIKSLIQDEGEQRESCSYSKLQIFRSMWNQTAPFFRYICCHKESSFGSHIF
uniref:Major facilitator superfamily (MFS) profile domain-containing protein n=1 Tax=Megaselia scalaris TaxID=36166 RepID=T1H280_MEGSC